jgi:hypothetical protein
LKDYVEAHENEAEGWRLLSQVEECLLNYAAARHGFQTAMSLSDQKDKKDLKRLALLKECESQRSDLHLTPAQLAELGNHLRARLSKNRCNHTLRFTDEWLKRAGVRKLKGVVDALRNQGGYCDREVLDNVVVG